MIFLRKTVRDLRSNKSRSIPIFVLILIAMLGSTLYIQAGESLVYTVDNYLSDVNQGDVWVDTVPITAAAFNSSVIDQWNTSYTIKDVQTRLFLQGHLIWNGKKIPLDIISYPAVQRAKVNDIIVADGKYFTDYPEIVAGMFVEQSYLKFYEFPVQSNLNVTIAGVGGFIASKNVTFTVLGSANSFEYPFAGGSASNIIYSGESSSLMRLSLYAREDYLHSQLFNGNPYFNQIVVKLKNPADTLPFMRIIRKNTTAMASSILRVREYPLLMKDMLALFTYVGWGMGIFLIAISMFLIYTMINRFLEEQKPQIGVLKALGYSDRQLTRINLYHGFLLGIVAELLGMLAGALLTAVVMDAILQQSFSFPYVLVKIPVEQLILLFLVVLSLVMTACYLSARKMRKISPQEAVRPPITGQTGVILRIEKFYQVIIKQRLSPTLKYQLRNLVIKPKRSLTTFTTLFLAILFISAPLLMIGSVINGSAAMFQSEKWDVQLLLDSYREFSSTRESIREENILPASATFEPLLTAPAKLYIQSDEWTQINFYAYQMNTTLKLFGQDSLIFANSTSAIVSWDFARKNDIEAGQNFTIVGQNGTSILIYIQTVLTEKYLSGFFIPFETGEFLTFGNASADYTNNILIGTDRAKIDRTGFESLPFISSVVLFTDLVEKYNQYIITGSPVFLVFFSVALFLGIMIIFGIQSITLSERKNDIAIFKSQGVPNKAIYRAALVEACIFTLLASTGYFIAYAVSSFYMDFLQTIVSLPMSSIELSAPFYVAVLGLGFLVSITGQFFSLRNILNQKIAAVTKEKMFG
ncbi:MAG: FtsX-like permease family protein [Candidatus Odinarchaeota archaeon]